MSPTIQHIANVNDTKFSSCLSYNLPQFTKGARVGQHKDEMKEWDVYITNSYMIVIYTELQSPEQGKKTYYKISKYIQPCDYTDMLRNKSVDYIMKCYDFSTNTFMWEKLDCVAILKAREIIDKRLQKEEMTRQQNLDKDWEDFIQNISKSVSELSFKLFTESEHITKRPIITVSESDTTIGYTFQCTSIDKKEGQSIIKTKLSPDVNWIRNEVQKVLSRNSHHPAWFICENYC